MLPDALAEISQGGFKWDVMPVCIVPFFFVVIAVRYIPKFLATPFWAIVDEDIKTLELKYLFRKPSLIQRDHIVSYEDAEVEEQTRSGSRRYPGCTIQLVDGTTILVSERGLDDISFIKSMLDYWSIKKLDGEEHYKV